MGLTRLRAEQISDIDYKQAVRVITVTDIANLSGGAPSQVDGVNLTAGDRILVTAQDPGSENGIYQVQTLGTGSNGTWIRSIDTNATGELEAGTIVMVTEGTVYKDTQWKLTTNNPIIIGTTPLTFEQNSAYAFGNIVANTTPVLADSVGDSVTFASGSGIQITGNNTTKTVTIAATGTAEVNSIANGTSNVTVVSSGGDVTVGIGGTANVAVFSTANITAAANLLPASNVTYSLGSTSSRWKDLWVANSSIYIGDVTIATVGSALTINGANVLTGNAGSAFSTTGNVTGGNILTSGLISATSTITSAANVIGGNIQTAGLITATGNIVGNYIIGNGSQLTGLPAGYANSDAAAYFASGTVSTNILTTAAVSATGNVIGGNITTAGLVSATGNVTGGNILTGGLISATSTITAAANITGGNLLTAGLISAAGAITTGGDHTLTGNIVDTGTLWINTLANGNINLNVSGTGQTNIPTGILSVTSNVQAGNLKTAGLISATGNVDAGNIRTAGLISATSSITSAANVVGGNITTAGLITATGNVTGGNLLTGGLISATSSITSAANVVGGNVTTAGLISATSSITSAANIVGGNITTAGLITATGNVIGGNIRTAGLITATGNITGGNILTGGLISATSTITSAANVTGGNITTAGLITATGNVIGGNLRTAGLITATGNVDAGNLRTAGLISATSSITSAANVVGGNITTAGLITATGNVIGGNITTAGLISATSTITSAANVVGGNITTAGLITATGNVIGGNIRTAGLITATGAITTAGDITLTGNIVDTGAIFVTTGANGNITMNPDGTGVVVFNKDLRNGQANGVGNIGSSTGYFNTVFARATSAQYADLAEIYVADDNYAPGTVVEFGGTYEVTITNQSHSTRVAGIVSTNPSYLMNATQTGNIVIPVALTGRVPCSVVGTIVKGDRLVASDIPGVAEPLDPNKYQPACIVGKALENYDSNSPGVIEVAVGRT